MIFLRLVSTLRNEASEVNIVFEFPIPKRLFATDSGGQSFGRVVYNLFARAPFKKIINHTAE